MTRHFAVADAPHVAPARSVRHLRLSVLLALLPGVATHAWWFGPGVLLQVGLAAAFALALEVTMLTLRSRAPSAALRDPAALLAGVLFALWMPPLAPWWISAAGMTAAIVVARHALARFHPIAFNPALVGCALVLGSWPWLASGSSTALAEVTRISFGAALEAVSGAAVPLDPREAARTGAAPWLLVAYALGCAWLLLKRVLTWQVPLTLLSATLLLAVAAPQWAPSAAASLLEPSTIATTLLVTLCIAGDPASGCSTARGRVAFGAGVALAWFAFRLGGAQHEAPVFAVLLLNVAAPWLDRLERPRHHHRVRDRTA